MKYGKWLVQKTNSEFVTHLARSASVSPAIAQVLINRGIKTPADVSGFLGLSVESMSDPFEISGVSRAVEILSTALSSGKRIMVHGDYDADGVTATSMVVDALRRIGLDVVYFIPNRFDHGYGFNPPAVKLAMEQGAGIILTVDCGVSSFEAVADARAMGIGVIITDHHEPVIGSDGKPILPEADAVINPKLCSPAISMLSGAGVAFKLVQALSTRFSGIFDPMEFLDLAALGTLADSVPLTGENRALVKDGMPMICAGQRPGIAALKDVAGLNGRDLKAGRVLFTIVPRINAAGRISDASTVVDLMLATSNEDAVQVAEELNRMNTERQGIEEGVFSEAYDAAMAKGDIPALVLAGSGWHEGVLGIVASRLVDRFGKPTFVMSGNNGDLRGSARSIPQFDIYNGLMKCSHCLKAFGGHRQAAGLTLERAMLGEFESLICDVVEQSVEDFTPALTLDASVPLRDISFKLVEEVARLEPFGYGNPEPLFGSRDLEVVNPRVVGRNHLKMTLKSNNFSVDSIGYGMGARLEEVQGTFAVDAAYAATINEWGDRRTLQLNLKAFRPSA